MAVTTNGPAFRVTPIPADRVLPTRNVYAGCFMFRVGRPGGSMPLT
jgi:hypothetical protein